VGDGACNALARGPVGVVESWGKIPITIALGSGYRP
jgi:hypothetical protein